ncbi:MAG: efflux RND transporter periplasmic adaptor subunit [Acidobacteria bacterium]|nr:efflux RND transporter periplasmic adaptor subunit [Acidobacteriota bacterium]
MPTLAAYASGPRTVRQLLCCAVLIAAVALTAGCGDKGTAAANPGAGGGKGGGRRGGGGDVPVTVATASLKDVPVEVQVIGNVEAYSTITVKAQVGGELTAVHFREGDFVKKGDVLFEIDRRPLEATLNQAIANAGRDRATLGQAEANLARDAAQAKYAESQARRYAELAQSGVISRDQAEQLRANADATAQAVNADKATIESAKAAIGSSEAAVQQARVQLSYTTIRSPIDGRTGNLTVKQGNVVMANSMDLMTINQIEPIYVTFAVPEAQLNAIKNYMVSQKLAVRAKPQDEDSSEEIGVLTFIDNTVDTTTGTIKLKGTFTNSDHKLWPGQFVRVTLRLTTQHNAVVVPNEAVQAGQNGQFIYVVKPDRTVDARPVAVGQRVDQDMVINSGLQAGEVVVTEGQLRLAPNNPNIKVAVRDGRGGRGGRGGQAQGMAPAQGSTEADAQPAPDQPQGAGGAGKKGGRRGGRKTE